MLMIIVYILNSICNYFLIIVLLSLGQNQDPKFYIGCGLAIFMGLILRFAIEWNNNTITLKRATVQLIMSLVLCYVAVLIWRDFTPNMKLEYYLFLSSLFSVFIVGLGEKTIKMGFVGYARILLRKVLADEAHPHKEEDL